MKSTPSRKESLTHIREIVHQYNLLYEVGRRSIQDTVDCPQEHTPGLVVEADDDAGRGEVVVVLLLLTPEKADESGVKWGW
ncbi:hypothetical protein NPIL_155081 [Nephila pilipes]|uniref:Uncharacterized protein n=1 Tax=Nephila pilipes TaxID=299642 RepID=A0A8X6TNP1_NEPPI|nr:hypothetical protein NPIL_155081 [Nephila pilipes]